MDLAAIAFYVLAAVTIGSGILVVLARNPVHSVLFLIAAFVSAAGLFVMLSAEFLAMLLVVVYVGAVAVLFLFVVMMLDIDFAQLREGFARYLPLGAVIAGVLAIEMVLVSSAVANRGGMAREVATPAADATNAEVIGRVLYTDYVLIFQAAGMVLLVAMIGAIVLTLRHRPHVKRQDIGRQVNRRRKDAIDVISVPTGQGVEL